MYINKTCTRAQNQHIIYESSMLIQNGRNNCEGAVDKKFYRLSSIHWYEQLHHTSYLNWKYMSYQIKYLDDFINGIYTIQGYCWRFETKTYLTVLIVLLHMKSKVYIYYMRNVCVTIQCLLGRSCRPFLFLFFLSSKWWNFKQGILCCYCLFIKFTGFKTYQSRT